MELKSRVDAQEQLLFELLGIAAHPHGDGDGPDCALLLGDNAPAPEHPPYLRLPDPAHPDRESEHLARLLGRAIGIGRVHL